MYEIVIIGAGISGVSFARLMQMRGINNYLILEKEDRAGGLCRTELTNGFHLDTGGGHFLCSRFPDVYQFIFAHLPKQCFKHFSRVSKIDLNGSIIDYPVESNLWQLPIDDQVDYLISAIQNGEQLNKNEPINYEEWIYWKLGNKIADNYLLPYNQKIWGVKSSEMDIDWLHKIPRVNLREILRASLVKRSNKDYFPSHDAFYYPVRGGFQTIFDAIFQKTQDHVRFNYQINSINRKSKYWIINNEIEAKQIINTAPWPLLRGALRPDTKIDKKIESLKNNSIVVSLYEKQYRHNWHWLYLPNSKIRHHREFFLKNFAGQGRKGGLFTETNARRWKKGLSEVEGGKLIAEKFNQFAYPIPTIGHQESIDTILAYYAKKGIYGLGRWGQWNYYNSDVCIKQGIELAKKIFP